MHRSSGELITPTRKENQRRILPHLIKKTKQNLKSPPLNDNYVPMKEEKKDRNINIKEDKEVEIVKPPNVARENLNPMNDNIEVEEDNEVQIIHKISSDKAPIIIDLTGVFDTSPDCSVINSKATTEVIDEEVAAMSKKPSATKDGDDTKPVYSYESLQTNNSLFLHMIREASERESSFQIQIVLLVNVL